MINRYKARILEIIVNSSCPATFTTIRKTIDIPKETLQSNLNRMVDCKEIERKKFSAEGMDASDYRVSERGGRTARSFYVPTPQGLRKYDYYKQKGIYEENINPRELWLDKKEGLIP